MANVRLSRRRQTISASVVIGTSALAFFLVSFAFLLRSGNDGSIAHQVPSPLLLRRDNPTSDHVIHTLPSRLLSLRARDELVGDNLHLVKEGKQTVDEILRGQKFNRRLHHHDMAESTETAPMPIPDIIGYLTDFLQSLHDTCSKIKRASHIEIWEAYNNLAFEMLYPFDRRYLVRMPKRRSDDSIFLSVASYRDENCLDTLKGAYGKATNPDNLYVGLVQQNCLSDCRSGVMDGGGLEDVSPDDDCHALFCSSPDVQRHCDAGRLRVLHVNETESLGPYMARYLASKLWYGESWFMQVDSHMTFLEGWDAISLGMLRKAPSDKPVISHYPPSHMQDLVKKADKPAPRLCGPVFASSKLEAQMVRLQGELDWDKKKSAIPKFAPFITSGYFIAHSYILRDVPFDPFLPWISMGDDILMSSRLWTSGYDIFSPTQSVVGHIYVRRHRPKFWESVRRVFTPGVPVQLQLLVLSRVKYLLGYPEAARDMITPNSVLTAVEAYSMGSVRTLGGYLKLVGLNMTSKEVSYTAWCEEGSPPPGFEKYASLYE